MSGELRNRWRVELEGDANVRAKLDALLTLQQKGLRATKEEIGASREAASAINAVTRNQSALIRSWQASHPQLALLSRGLSGLAAVGRSVLNIITSINVMQIRQAEEARRLRDAQQDVITKQQLYNDALRQFGADHPETVKRLQELTAALDDLGIVSKEIDARKLQDIGTGVGSIMDAMRIPVDIAQTVLIFKLLGQTGNLGAGIGIAASYLTRFVGALAGLAPLGPVIGQIISDLINGLSRLAGGEKLNLGILDPALWVRIGQEITKWGAEIIQFVADIPKHFQIMDVRVRRWIEDMWTQIINVFSSGTKKALDQISKWKDDIIKYFQELYKKIVGGSIIPDLMDQMNTITQSGLTKNIGFYEKWSLNVEAVTKALGDRVGNILINDFQRATDAVSRIDDIARTRSLTKNERQQLQEAQTTQHVLGGAGGMVNQTRASGYANTISTINEAWRRLIGYAPGGQAATNMLNQNPGLVTQFNSMLRQVRAEQSQGNTINITVQGSLITERELVTKVSQAIAQAV